MTMTLDSLAWRPSEYSAALIHVIRRRPDLVRGARVLELGVGCGAVLASAGLMGASSLCGVDVEPGAVQIASDLLRTLDLPDISDLHVGDMWSTLGGRQFDLIVANLPQFPMPDRPYGGRLATWSCGGENGRLMLDRLLDRLHLHLAPEGRALLTHNGFIGLDETASRLARHGMFMTLSTSQLVNISADKLDLMCQTTRMTARGTSIIEVGDTAFGEFHVVEIGHKEA